MIILGIETSCDDTAVSVVEKKRKELRLRSHIHYSQIPIHARFGGVIPEVAAREHAVTITPTIREALIRSSCAITDITHIAVTQGPGLAPALSVGVDAARILSGLYTIPLRGVNHIEGHIASVWPLVGIQDAHSTPPPMPALALVVSGGHTELHLVHSFGKYTLLGKTRDDAVGEAFDKVATLLGLPYPGGPEISAQALLGDRSAFDFPRPMMSSGDYDFSFAGLKTAVRYSVAATKRKTARKIHDTCASFEQAAVDVLVHKTIKAIHHYKVKSVLVVGGVSANTYLRKKMSGAVAKVGIPLFLAPKMLTSDNATMICMAAAYGSARLFSSSMWKNLSAEPQWELYS